MEMGTLLMAKRRPQINVDAAATTGIFLSIYLLIATPPLSFLCSLASGAGAKLREPASPPLSSRHKPQKRTACSTHFAAHEGLTTASLSSAQTCKELIPKFLTKHINGLALGLLVAAVVVSSVET